MNEKLRDKNIDVFKAILVAVMVLGHVLEFLTEEKTISNTIIRYSNLISFSGFLFCFGHNVYTAYLTKNEHVRKRLLKNFFRLLIAFYISGIAFELFVEKNNNITDYLQVLLLLRLPGYSEFLATFAILNLLIFMFLKFLKYIIKYKKALVICSIISILTTFVPCEKISFLWSNLLIGAEGVSFPILQYLSLFFIGIYFAKYRPKFNLKIFLLTMIASVFYIITYKIDFISGRFPPKIGFIIGSYMFLYLNYYIALYITSKFDKNNIVDSICFIRRKYIIIFSNK